MLDVAQSVRSIIGGYDCFELEGCEKGVGRGSEDEVFEVKVVRLDFC